MNLLLLILLQTVTLTQGFTFDQLVSSVGAHWGYCNGGDFHVLCITRVDPQGRKRYEYAGDKVLTQYIRVKGSLKDDVLQGTAVTLIKANKWTLQDGLEFNRTGFDTMEYEVLDGGAYREKPINYVDHRIFDNCETYYQRAKELIQGFVVSANSTTALLYSVPQASSAMSSLYMACKIREKK